MESLASSSVCSSATGNSGPSSIAIDGPWSDDSGGPSSIDIGETIVICSGEFIVSSGEPIESSTEGVILSRWHGSIFLRIVGVSRISGVALNFSALKREKNEFGVPAVLGKTKCPDTPFSSLNSRGRNIGVSVTDDCGVNGDMDKSDDKDRSKGRKPHERLSKGVLKVKGEIAC